MGSSTAEDVLKKTFDHLDEILKESSKNSGSKEEHHPSPKKEEKHPKKVRQEITEEDES